MTVEDSSVRPVDDYFILNVIHDNENGHNYKTRSIYIVDVIIIVVDKGQGH